MTSFTPAPVPAELLTGCLPPYPLPTPVPWPGLGDANGPLPLQDTRISGRVTGLGLRITVRHRYRNDRATPIEASYVFPLPDRCAVTAMTATLAGIEVRGVLSERGAAREAYDEAVAAGARTVLVEQERGDVFTATLGNLPPGEEAVVELTLTGALAVDDGLATLRFPLVVGERYVPGGPNRQPPVGTGTVPDTDQVPDASRITPPRIRTDRAAGIEVDLYIDPAGLGGDAPELSTTPGLVAETDGPGWRLTNEAALAPDHDLVVRYPYGTTGTTATAVLATDEDDPTTGTWQVVVAPGEEQRAAARPRDVVVLLDRSGSMGGWKMVAARRAAARIVDSLGAEDRFTVLAFDHEIETPPADDADDALRNGSDRHRFAAATWLGAMTARGGTELAAPLHRAAELLTETDAGRERVLVLVTDGQVGNEAAILHALADRLGGIRVYALGVDQAVNATFLRNLAALGGGRCDLVDNEDDLDTVLQRLQRRIAPPLVQALAVEATGLDLAPGSVTPAAVDLFPAGPAVLTGRWTSPRPVRGEVAFTVAGQGRTGHLVEWRPATHRVDVEADALRTTWARGRVADLENAHDAHGGPTAPIVELSLVHGVLSRFTAWLAIGPDGVTGDAMTVAQPVPRPAGWANPRTGGFAGPVRQALHRLARGASPRLAAPRSAAPGFAGPLAPAALPAQPVLSARAGAAPRSGFVDADTESFGPADLRPFLPRITAVLDRADSGGDDEFSLDLAELLDDLRSVLAPEDLVAALAAVRADDPASVAAARTAVAQFVMT